MPENITKSLYFTGAKGNVKSEVIYAKYKSLYETLTVGVMPAMHEISGRIVSVSTFYTDQALTPNERSYFVEKLSEECRDIFDKLFKTRIPDTQFLPMTKDKVEEVVLPIGGMSLFRQLVETTDTGGQYSVRNDTVSVTVNHTKDLNIDTNSYFIEPMSKEDIMKTLNKLSRLTDVNKASATIVTNLERSINMLESLPADKISVSSSSGNDVMKVLVDSIRIINQYDAKLNSYRLWVSKRMLSYANASIRYIESSSNVNFSPKKEGKK
jgi:hypothetical protein